MPIVIDLVVVVVVVVMDMLLLVINRLIRYTSNSSSNIRCLLLIP